jgi:hypothetical protein
MDLTFANLNLVEIDSDSECGDKSFVRSPIAESRESVETSPRLGARNRNILN